MEISTQIRNTLVPVRECVCVCVCARMCVIVYVCVHVCAHVFAVQGGPESLENESIEILDSKREDRISLFFLNCYKPVRFVLGTCFASALSVRHCGTCESSRRSARR